MNTKVQLNARRHQKIAVETTLRIAENVLVSRRPRGVSASQWLYFLGSSELLIFSYAISVLYEFKPLFYIVIIFFISGMSWRVTARRVIVFGLLLFATLFFFTTNELIVASLNTTILLLGLFSRMPMEARNHIVNSSLLWGTLALIFYCLLYTDRFDPNEGVVSHNFIAIVGLYMLLVAAKWRRRRLFILCVCLSTLVLLVGSRSGAVVFFLIAFYIINPKLALVIALFGVSIFISGFDTNILPPQFHRNYEQGIDPRMFIWAEFVTDALSGNVFRRQDFDFMVTFNLDRNFHNSVLEAYYRLGPFVLVLLALHFHLLWRTRANKTLFVIVAALFAKGLFDTYLWFSPIDLLVFKEYGSRLFDRPLWPATKLSQTLKVSSKSASRLFSKS